MNQAGNHSTTIPAIVAPSRGPVLNVLDGVPMADSRDVARFFGKQHKHVLEAIRAAKCTDGFRRSNFRPFEINDLHGTSTSHVLMTKNGFAFVVLAFTGDKASLFREEYIEAYDAMEIELRSRQAPPANSSGLLEALRDPATALALIAHHAQETLTARAETAVVKVERDEARAEAAIAREEVLQAAPKLDAYDHLLDDTGTCNLSNAARILGAEQKAFFAWLRKGGYVFDNGEATLPRADLRKDGRFKVRLLKVRRNHHVEQTLVTRQGLVWLSHRWAAKLARDAREAAAARIQGELGL